MPDATRRKRREDACAALYRRHYRRAGVIERDEALRQAVLRHLTPETALLDAGCGARGECLVEYASHVARAVGVDLEITPDPPAGVELYQGDLASIPMPANTFDVVMSRSVLEHLVEPAAVFRELARVTRPGGTLILTAPTKWDYGSIGARLTGTGFHRRFLGWIGGDGADYDNFPTHYKVNTRRDITAYARRAGLRVVEIRGLSHPPYYLRFSVLLYGLGIAYDRFISRIGWHELMGTWLIILRKP